MPSRQLCYRSGWRPGVMGTASASSVLRARFGRDSSFLSSVPRRWLSAPAPAPCSAPTSSSSCSRWCSRCRWCLRLPRLVLLRIRTLAVCIPVSVARAPLVCAGGLCGPSSRWRCPTGGRHAALDWVFLRAIWAIQCGWIMLLERQEAKDSSRWRVACGGFGEIAQGVGRLR